MSTPRYQARNRRIPSIAIAIAVAAILAIAAGAWWWSKREAGGDEGRYRTATVERGDIRVAISSTGTLSAITTVTVGSQISGQVTAVLVDFNSPVKKGDVLARIDPSTYEAQIAQGSAQIASGTPSGKSLCEFGFNIGQVHGLSEPRSPLIRHVCHRGNARAR